MSKAYWEKMDIQLVHTTVDTSPRKLKNNFVQSGNFTECSEFHCEGCGEVNSYWYNETVSYIPCIECDTDIIINKELMDSNKQMIADMGKISGIVI